MSDRKPRPKLKRDITRVVVVTFFFAGVAWVLQHPAIREEVLNIDHLRGRFRERKLLFMLVGAAVTGVGFPRLWLAAIAGTLYGALLGTGLALAASLGGAVLNFCIGRWALRGPIRRFLAAPRVKESRFAIRQRLARLYHGTQEHGFRWVLYARLFPLSNATLVNIVCGASKTRLGDFVLATAIGYLPFTLVFALFGSSAAKQKPMQLGLGTVLFILVLAGRWALKRRTSDVSSQLEEEDAPASS